MTGFARRSGESGDATWSCEIRAVNGKGLDVRLRLPSGLEALDSVLRKACANKIARGNLQIAITVQTANTQPLPVVNEAVLEAVHKALKVVRERTGTSMPDAAQILALRGVLETSDSSVQGFGEELQGALLVGLNETLNDLISHRQAEGTELFAILSGQIDEIENLSQRAKDDPNRSQKAIKERMIAHIERLGDVGASIDEDRLAVEVALLATKADIQEELDRLNAHVASARSLLKEGSPVGRKLEFLAQEFNREANTLCSKSNAVSITDTGMALKVVVDQFREQVLNVE